MLKVKGQILWHLHWEHISVIRWSPLHLSSPCFVQKTQGNLDFFPHSLSVYFGTTRRGCSSGVHCCFSSLIAFCRCLQHLQEVKGSLQGRLHYPAALFNGSSAPAPVLLLSDNWLVSISCNNKLLAHLSLFLSALFLCCFGSVKHLVGKLHIALPWRSGEDELGALGTARKNCVAEFE